jgi:hypothetical protein
VNYTDYLKQILMPLGIYDLESGLGAQELAVIGEQMDTIFDALEEIRREAFLASAESYGLTNFMNALPFTPASLTLEDERRAVMALLRIRGGCFTLPMLQDTVSGCGLKATIEESTEPMTVLVRFPQNRGVPENFEKLKRRISEIVPCHLKTDFQFIYSSWEELMAKLKTWGEAQERVGTWKEIEIYI